MRRLIFLLLLLLIVLPVSAQTENETNANISWPPPVFAVQGQFELRGTANVPNMTNYFIEYRPINDDLTPQDDAPWLPVTLPTRGPVLDDVLGVWDTTLDLDGLYELRLTVNVAGGQPVFFILSPVRVLNDLPPFVSTPTPTPVPVTATPALPTVAPATNTPAPSPTPIDTSPRAEAITSANVRSGDSVAYEVIGALQVGESARILAISATGSGWYQIELPNGRQGWVSPTVVRVTGTVSNLPRVQPPPPPTATPIPATPTPITQVNLIIAGIFLTPTEPVCNETFVLTVRVQNAGTRSTATSGLIDVQNVHVGSGTVTESAFGGMPILQPGATFDAVIPITVDTFFGEQHRIDIMLDPQNQIPETSTTDNAGAISYTLLTGSCG